MLDLMTTPSGTKTIVEEINEIVDDWDLDPITRQIKMLKEQKDDIKAEIAQLKAYSVEDPYQDGTTIIWHVKNKYGYAASQAAVRDGGGWYVTGEIRRLSWPSLVVEHLTQFRDTEVEIIHTIEEVEPDAELGVE